MSTRKVNQKRRKHRQTEKNRPARPSEDSLVRNSISTTAPNNPNMPPHDSTSSPQMPPSAPTFANHNESLGEIVVAKSPKPRATTPTTATIFPLLPPNSITTPKATASASPGSGESSSTASHKRSYDEMFSPSIGSTSTFQAQFGRKLHVGNFLARQLKEHLEQGLLSKMAVLNVLEDLEMNEFLQSDDSGRATADSIVQGIIYSPHNNNTRYTRKSPWRPRVGGTCGPQR